MQDTKQSINRLRADDLYAYIAEHSPIIDSNNFYAKIIERREDLIYDIAMTNQQTIASKLNMSQGKLSTILAILKAL